MSYNVTSTNDYNQFKKLPGQRPIKETRVQSLMKSILERDKLYLFPIIVNGNREVVDGQHRLEAAKRLKKYIFYMIDNHSKEKDTLIIHSNRFNWSLYEHVHYYAEYGDEEYKFLYDLWIKNRVKMANFSIFMKIICMFCIPLGHELYDNLKNGNLKLKNKQQAIGFIDRSLDNMIELNRLTSKNLKMPMAKIFFKSNYIAALSYCYKKMSEEEYEYLWGCIKRDYLIYRSISYNKDVYEMFERSYNLYKKTFKLDFKKIFPKDSKEEDD